LLSSLFDRVRQCLDVVAISTRHEMAVEIHGDLNRRV